MIICIIICSINILTKQFICPKSSFYKEGKYNLHGRIIEYSIDGNQLNIIFEDQEKIKGVYYFKEKDLLSKTKNKIKIGDEIDVKGKLNKPVSNRIPHTFNYAKYLKNNDIYYIMKIDSFKFKNHSNNMFFIIKNAVIKRIENLNKNKEYLYTFIIGNKNYLESKMYEKYKNNGISHLFAISGMHISFLVVVLKKILKNIPDLLEDLIIISFLIFYAFLSNYSASILRASIFYIFLLFNKKLKLNMSTLKCLIYSIIFLLLLNYKLIFNLGFQFSCLATLGLILSSKYYENKSYIFKIFLTSLIATLFTLPISLNNFYEFNISGIIHNIIFVPLISLIIFPLSLLVFLFPHLNIIFSLSIDLMEFLTTKLQLLNIIINVPKFNACWIIIYYFFLILLIKNLKIRYALCIIFLITFLKIRPYLDPSTSIYFLDVNQGDCIVLQGRYNKKVIMIDTGGMIKYNLESWQQKNKIYNLSDNTITFLKSLGIKKLDSLILTHGDFDHMGEAINIINKIKVNKVIFNNDNYNKLESDLIKTLKKKQIDYYQNVKELNFDKSQLYFLNTKIYNNENDNSNIIYFNCLNYQFLLMGDAGVEVENNILNNYDIKNIDVLKVGHHGSKTSSGTNFINKIKPKYALISVGNNNKYNHPHQEVLDNLKNSKIYRTDLSGSITFKIRSNYLKIVTE